MKIIIDADGCPVVNSAINIAQKYEIDVILISNTSHLFDLENFSNVNHILADKGRDSADFLIINKALKKDIVVTQDYALAVMCISKGAFSINQNGFSYTDKNIDELLFRRHIGQKLRKNGNKGSRIKKRTKINDECFEKELVRLINILNFENIWIDCWVYLVKLRNNLLLLSKIKSL